MYCFSTVAQQLNVHWQNRVCVYLSVWLQIHVHTIFTWRWDERRREGARGRKRRKTGRVTTKLDGTSPCLQTCMCGVHTHRQQTNVSCTCLCLCDEGFYTCLSVCLHVLLSTYQTACPCVSLSFGLSCCLSASACLFVCQSSCPAVSVLLSLWLSVCAQVWCPSYL